MFGYRSQERFVFAAYALAILILCYVVDRADFGQVILCYALSFYSYYHWIEKRRFRTLKSILTHAIIIRVLLALSLPQLSDDYYRFIWDGLVQIRGINPFSLLPSAITDPSTYMSVLLDKMNSPDYYSVYPPVLQGVWKGVSALVGEHSLWQVMLMRAVIILADVGVIVIAARILRLMNKWEGSVALYALNPLVIVELTGNLHFEGLMICFVLIGIYLFMRAKAYQQWAWYVLGGLTMALGVLSKVVLVLALPAMWRYWGWAKTIVAGSISLVFVILGCSLYLDWPMLQHMGQSFDLYFRNFEFNASLYNLVEYIASFWIPHYTAAAIGIYISLVMVLGILLLAFFRKAKSPQAYFETLLFILSVHLLFASTVHPWYVINLVAVALFTTYRYPMIWSFAVVISYFMYANDYHEVWWLLAIEYVLVMGYAVYEIGSNRQGALT